MAKIRTGIEILSWSLYDLANQFFSLNIISLYFVQWIVLEKGSAEILYSFAYGISNFFIAVFSPVLGAISDAARRKRIFLVSLTIISVFFTIALGFVTSAFLGLLFFAAANFGCSTAVTFYNAQLVDISPKGKIGLISGLGRMFSYLGAILALYLIKPVVARQGYQAAFLPTGILFLLFALPDMIFVKDREGPGGRIDYNLLFKKEKIIEALISLKRLLFNNQEAGGFSNFLKAAFFGTFGVNVVMLFMSVYAARAFNLNESEVANLIVFSTFFAILGSLVSGYLSDYLGHKRFLGIVFISWIACFILGAISKGVFAYHAVGALVGVTLGSTWVVLRALAVKIAPESKMAEVFGLFNLAGFLSAILGPLYWGLILLFLKGFGEWGYRVSLLSLALFTALGLIFLLRIKNSGDLKYE
ncbi:MAG: MFS transporter [Candidatus Omnitrophota bacterium]